MQWSRERRGQLQDMAGFPGHGARVCALVCSDSVHMRDSGIHPCDVVHPMVHGSALDRRGW